MGPKAIEQTARIADGWLPLTVYLGGMGAKGKNLYVEAPSASDRARPPATCSACSWPAIAPGPRTR
jgi:hypothetical protein